MSPSHPTAVVIFAKYPTPGKVKTRLASGPVGHHPALTLEQCSDIYYAFLRDYVHRFTHCLALPVQPFFCLRPTPHEQAFREAFGQGAIQVAIEPTWQGQAAQDIGQAMGFTIRHFLAMGFQHVLLLGSDLPHIPKDILKQAIALFEDAPLVLGNDGGGCYLVGASEPTPILEDQCIPWSQGRDFQALIHAQEHLGKTVACLSDILEDIDQPDALDRLCQQLQHTPDLQTQLPHTTLALQQLEMIP